MVLRMNWYLAVSRQGFGNDMPGYEEQVDVQDGGDVKTQTIPMTDKNLWWPAREKVAVKRKKMILQTAYSSTRIPSRRNNTRI